MKRYGIGTFLMVIGALLSAAIAAAQVLPGPATRPSTPPAVQPAQAVSYKHMFPGTPWPDRRSIGIWMLSSPEFRTVGFGANPADIIERNPQGWNGDLTCLDENRQWAATAGVEGGRAVTYLSLDARKPDYAETFAKRYKAIVTRSLDFYDAKVASGAWQPWQGMITWDIEGFKHNAPVSYIGRPLAGYLPQEMPPSLVLWTVQTLEKHGLKAGFTIRHTVPKQTLYPDAKGESWQQELAGSPEDVIISTINAIRQAYGPNACIFYFDSNLKADAWASPHNHGKALPLDASVLANVAKRMPGNLIIPEFGAACRIGENDYSLRYTELGYYKAPGVAPLRYAANRVFTSVDAMRQRLDLTATERLKLGRELQAGRAAGGFDAIMTDKDSFQKYRAEIVAELKQGDIMLLPGPWLGAAPWLDEAGDTVDGIYKPAEAMYREARAQ